MNETTNGAIEAWDAEEIVVLTESTDDLTMSAPAVLSLPVAMKNLNIKKEQSVMTSLTGTASFNFNFNNNRTNTTNSTNTTNTVNPTRPTTDKIMYVSSPRSRNAKITETVTMSNLDFMIARKKYDIQIPDKVDAAAAALDLAAKADAASEGNKKGGKGKKGDKGKEKKKTKAQLQTELEERWISSKVDLLAHYSTCCQKLQIAVDPLIMALVSREPEKNDSVAPLSKLRIDPNDPMPPPSEEEAKKKKSKGKKNTDGEDGVTTQNGGRTEAKRRKPLGAGGTRAFMSALAGGWVGGEDARMPRSGAPKGDKGLKNQFVSEKRVELKDSKKKKKIIVKAEGYTFLTSFEIRNGKIKTLGAASIGDYLTRPQSKTLTKLVLFNCSLEAAGAAALGRALRFGENRTLTKLAIDCDATIGDVGVAHLCRGLETNPSLTDLSLCCCGFKEDGAKSIASLLTSARSSIQLLSIRGNIVGDVGLTTIATAIARKDNKGKNTCKLVFLNAANIGVDGSMTDALTTFGSAVNICKTLRAINFDYNPIGQIGGQALIDGWEGVSKSISHVKQFVVSSSLPASIFCQIHQSSGGGKKSKKKKKKKKSKKGKNVSGVAVPEIIPDIQIAMSWMAKQIERRKAAAAEEASNK